MTRSTWLLLLLLGLTPGCSVRQNLIDDTQPVPKPPSVTTSANKNDNNDAKDGQDGKDSVEGNRQLTRAKRTVPPFHALYVEGAFDVVATCQAKQDVELKAESNLLPLITTDVRDGVLYIAHKKGFVSSQPMQVVLSVPNLDGLHMDGSGTIKVLNLKSDALKAAINGSGKITLDGSASTLAGSINGSGMVLADHLNANDATLSVNGSGSMQVHAEKTLTVSIAGSANIEYSGNPAVTQSINGSGHITKR